MVSNRVELSRFTGAQVRPLLVELDELVEMNDTIGSRQWRETGRWIKYEEDLEEGAHRFGKPHVAVLSFHSLINVRTLLVDNGVTLLDMQSDGFVADLCIKIVDALVTQRKIGIGAKERVLEMLNLRHSHVQDRPSLVDIIKPDGKRHVQLSAKAEAIMKRLAPDTEAASVLVGAVPFLDQPFMAFVRLQEAVQMHHIMELPIPIRFFIVLMGPHSEDIDYRECGRTLATLMSNQGFREVAYRALHSKLLVAAINEFLDDSIVVPPGEWDSTTLLPIHEMKNKIEVITVRKKERKQSLTPSYETPKQPMLVTHDPLTRTQRPFGGLVNDVRLRFPLYKSDILDSFNGLCLSTIIFIYFAVLSGSITFGGLMGQETDNLIGVSETLVSGCVSGCIFALLAGQPMIIVGTTGPLLIFDASLYAFCRENKYNYLGLRVWVGIWIGVISLVMAGVEGSCLVRFFSRFTQEIFSSLISLLFIYESFYSLYKIFKNNPLLTDYCAGGNSTNNDGTTAAAAEDESVEPPKVPVNQPNTALLSTILMLGTFFIAYFLRHFRNSSFLGRTARRALGDFGVPIAIVTMSAVNFGMSNVPTAKLNVPEGLSPSSPPSVRGWLIPLSMNLPNSWLPFAACVPAILVFILIFMETQICELIICKKERKLRKGSGFHLDITLLCVLNVGCGFMGAPFLTAATIRSVTHVSALSIWGHSQAPGEKSKMLGVQEQRVTALVVSVLTGCSVAMSSLLRLVPVAVLFGVFLYMGVSSMNGIQYFERLQLVFKSVESHPQVGYVRGVETRRMNLFTLVQTLGLVTLWAVKSSPAALAFPFVLLFMVPLTFWLKYIFTEKELYELDGDEGGAEEEDADFYAQAHMPGPRKSESRKIGDTLPHLPIITSHQLT